LRIEGFGTSSLFEALRRSIEAQGGKAGTPPKSASPKRAGDAGSRRHKRKAGKS
jgi:hypothetical protein